MESIMKKLLVPLLFAALMTLGACSGGGGVSGGEGEPMFPGPVQDLPAATDGDLHNIFYGDIGIPYSASSMGAVDPDPTGHNPCDDYDGDGIPNSDEIISNPFVADYPRIVTRIVAPLTMEIRISKDIIEDNYTETITSSDLEETIKNSMEDKHYASANQKTTPYVTKESLSDSGKHADSYGYSDAQSSKDSLNINGSVSVGGENTMFATKVAFGFGKTKEQSTSNSENTSVEDSFSSSTMSEKTVFQDVDYVDNLDRNGVEFSSDTVQRMTSNYRKSTKVKQTDKIGPEDGYVRASLFIKNTSVNMPVSMSNVVCTLSFRTPSGQQLPVKTFTLQDETGNNFEQEVYGDEELGPFTIEFENLNTHEVMVALANGYVPQIHVVSYDMHRVEDSNYNPGVDNLKIVEETAKARTALIKIIGTDIRETYRVCAFDTENQDTISGDYDISPGISLKKALFRILRDRVGNGETWDTDTEGNDLTVIDENLKWKAISQDKEQYVISESNPTGNSWNNFETYVKTYYDDKDQEKHIETIKRIGKLKKYNPFSKDDNTSYDPNELLGKDEVLKMKFWVIFHNGRYYEGDLNDPIWAGERYEIVCMDMYDFNQHMESYAYAPFQTRERMLFDTRWNALSDSAGDYSRAVYLGRVLPNDVVQLEVDLIQSRFLFDNENSADGFGTPEVPDGQTKSYLYNFNYRFEKEGPAPSGIPGEFTHSAFGGANNIHVSIEEAENAQRYEITFEEVDVPANKGIVEITADELEKSNGSLIINSQSTITGVNEVVGGANAGKEYKVSVSAIGKVYTTTVTTKSSSKSLVVYVKESAGNPQAFDFGSVGLTNTINLSISASEDAEYFVIRCTGPINYADGTATVTDVIGHVGFNSIEVPSPASAKLEDQDFEDGLYAIEVFARNKFCITDTVGAYSNTKHLLVKYDQYHNQKQFSPKIASQLFGLEAVDFEVNFNEGSGWLKLQPANPMEFGMQHEDESKVIDCYYSSYMDKDVQKFSINFKPPTGNYGLPNVFFGGRDDTKVYIRTIPKPKYRDSIWMRPELDANGDPITSYTDYNTVARYLLFDFLIDDKTDITDYWTGLEETDATLIEDTVADLSNDGISSTAAVDDFFFSPKEQRLYLLRASVSNEIQIVEGYRPNAPGLSTDPPFPENKTPSTYHDNMYINLSSIKSDYSTSYSVYLGDDKVDIADLEGKALVDVYGTSWINSVEWLYTRELGGSDTEFTMDESAYGYTDGKVYTVCVAARNKYGVSIPACRQVVIPVRPEEIAKYGTSRWGEARWTVSE